ncbi:MAG: hypothetical protein HKN24_04800 [Acidimicrobiales bacterium]|nr:hypothetical protein [Acidimicrobiales bacterium]
MRDARRGSGRLTLGDWILGRPRTAEPIEPHEPEPKVWTNAGEFLAQEFKPLPR